MKKTDLLHTLVEHYDIKTVNVVPMIDMMEKTAFQARNLARAAKIVDEMVSDQDCGIILTLAGSLISAGQKGIVLDMMRANMIDAIVSTGANIVDQDFFEALGYRHYQGSPFASDNDLRERAIDRIYDTYIDEDELRVCDDTIRVIADSLEPRPYSSREFIVAMGKYLDQKFPKADSIVLEAYRLGIPIFCPAFSDCSAGFGLVFHQVANQQQGKPYASIDSVADFRELTQIKVESGVTGLIMLGGGVPKNFVQDIVVSAEFLGYDVAMHKYAVQLTVADERDGALSGSTLKEANSWGKVDLAKEQMVFGEATVTFPLIAGYAWHKGSWRSRQARSFNSVFSKPLTMAKMEELVEAK
ncbi:MAG TPA: deoxyhypusine synthase [Terriglobales bacterium]|nr:deoxyhypusine synthase [Terriglobales bacterium]